MFSLLDIHLSKFAFVAIDWVHVDYRSERGAPVTYTPSQVLVFPLCWHLRERVDFPVDARILTVLLYVKELERITKIFNCLLNDKSVPVTNLKAGKFLQVGLDSERRSHESHFKNMAKLSALEALVIFTVYQLLLRISGVELSRLSCCICKVHISCYCCKWNPKRENRNINHCNHHQAVPPVRWAPIGNNVPIH